jgi:hypothetical protein
MAAAGELLQAANYALRKEGDRIRAEKIAREILRSYPDSEEASYARTLLLEIEGKPKPTERSGKEPTPPPQAKVEVLNQSREVVLKDIDIPFFKLVGIMVIWLIAAIPAIIIASIIITLIVWVLGAVLGIPLLSRL